MGIHEKSAPMQYALVEGERNEPFPKGKGIYLVCQRFEESSLYSTGSMRPIQANIAMLITRHNAQTVNLQMSSDRTHLIAFYELADIRCPLSEGQDVLKPAFGQLLVVVIQRLLYLSCIFT